MSPTNRAAWNYRYYAGFSTGFVEDVVKSLRLSSEHELADPWNGSGTSTAVAEKLGINSWGGDLNPAMTVVAKARLLTRTVSPSELSLCESIIARAEEHPALIDNDPFRVWFSDSTSRVLRALERSIALHLDPRASEGPPSNGDRVTALSRLASFFYVVLFQVVRESLAPFRSTNPTWIRRPREGEKKLRVSPERVMSEFRRHTAALSAASDVATRSESEVSGLETGSGNAEPVTRIAVASSTRLPLSNATVDAVISSPPYCTRLDYAVATSAELAVLGVNSAAMATLRQELIGSSTVAVMEADVDVAWGPTCARFVSKLSRHRSKASSGYYLKTHLQYFDGLSKSLQEIDRVLRPRGACVLVVQDSFYKEIRNDLARIVVEMADASGWTLTKQHDYRSNRLIARMHPGSRVYRSHLSATESVLAFTKAAR